MPDHLSGCLASGRRDLNPRPPEPHSDRGSRQERQFVGFSGLPSVGNDILPYSMPYFVGRNGNLNGNRSPSG
jgi:hypothetical protein